VECGGSLAVSFKTLPLMNADEQLPEIQMEELSTSIILGFGRSILGNFWQFRRFWQFLRGKDAFPV
jgi:hypothetical protein